jgi:hypothetical protein
VSQSRSTAVLGERYRLLERIAAGGMGTVWRAEDTVLHRPVAVKMLNEGLSADQRFVERFRGEAKAAAGLVHPNVAGVYDYGEDGGRPYIVMELIEGETLAARLRGSGPLEPEEVARIGAGVADGLAAAHEAGFVHRDVKPANVMITPRDDVKIMDFGIAAPSSGTGLTGTGMVMGTARYLSPEQAVGHPATPASNLYSLGVVLYELLAGAPPFDRESPIATAIAHVREPRTDGGGQARDAGVACRAHRPVPGQGAGRPPVERRGAGCRAATGGPAPRRFGGAGWGIGCGAGGLRGRAHGGAHRRSRHGPPPAGGGRGDDASPDPDTAARRRRDPRPREHHLPADSPAGNRGCDGEHGYPPGLGGLRGSHPARAHDAPEGPRRQGQGKTETRPRQGQGKTLMSIHRARRHAPEGGA